MIDSFGELRRTIAEDYVAHGRDWTKPGFRTVAVHRFGVWRLGISAKLFRAPMTLLYRWAFRRCRNVYGIELPYTVKLGRRVIIEHQGGIVVHGNTEIGNDCIIRQGCTLGIRSLADLTAAPVLEDGVSLGANAVVLGRVRIGAGTAVGANSVVLHDLPSGCIAVGAPAQVVRRAEQVPC